MLAYVRDEDAWVCGACAKPEVGEGAAEGITPFSPCLLKAKE